MDHRRIAYLRQRRQPQARAIAARDNRATYWIALLAGLLIALLMATAARADEPVQVSAGSIKLKAGQTAVIPVQVKIASGWHIFGAQPLVQGVRPASVTFAAASGLSIVNVALPAAKKIHVAALDADANVYEQTVQIPVKVKADPKAAGAMTLDGTLSFQACSDKQCLLPKKLAFKVPVTVVK